MQTHLTMKFPTLQRLNEESLRAAHRFPLSLLSSILATILLIYIVEKDSFTDNLPLLNLLMTFALGIPLFFGGQKAKITASKVQEEITRSDYELNKQLVENRYLSAIESYKKYQETINYFEETALKNAQLMTETADQHYLNGNINYLEWVLLINQSISIQSDYIDALRNRNIAITEINSYITQ